MEKVVLQSFLTLVLIVVNPSLFGQMLNEYTVGVDSRGNYGFSLNRGNEQSLFQLSYANLNMNNTFRLKNLSTAQGIFASQVSTIGVGYFRKKPLSSTLSMYYGGSLHWGNSPIKSVGAPKNNLSDINLQLGLKYKLSENITIGAEFRQSYGNYWMNTLMPSWSNSPIHSDWSTW